MMAHMACASHFRRHIHDGGCNPLPHARAQALDIVDAVLQAQHQRIVSQKRRYFGSSAIGIGGFHTKQHQLRAGHGLRRSFRAHRQACTESAGFEQQTALANRFDMTRPADQGELVAGASQHAAVIAADRACAHHRDPHRRLSRTARR
jgi:hypothetical protein